MIKYIILITFIFLIIGGGFIYWLYEKPEQQEVNSKGYLFLKYINSQGKQVEADYYIRLGGKIYQEGKTLKDGYLQISIPSNSTADVYAKINNSYMTYFQEYIKDNSQIRVDLKENVIGHINLDYDIKNDKEILLNFTSENVSRPFFCLAWSKNFLYLDSENEKIEVPKRLKYKVNKCFNISNETVVSYKIFKSLDEQDFIKVYIIDRDITPWSDGEYIYETPDLKDVGKTDKIEIINKFK
ncbi:MAG: hypothetical protein ACOCV1_00155 [Bacillota bacterium]